MDTKFPYGDPEAIEKKRALEFLALSWEEKYKRLMQMIKLSYEIRQAGPSATSTPNKHL